MKYHILTHLNTENLGRLLGRLQACIKQKIKQCGETSIKVEFVSKEALNA